MGWTRAGSLGIDNNSIDWNNDEIRYALLLSTYSFSNTHATWADVSASEFVSSNANYVSFSSAGGGKLLASKSIITDANRTVFRAAAQSIANLAGTGTLTIGGVAVLQVNNTTKNDSVLIATIDFSTIHTANGGQLDINWGGAGNNELLVDTIS